MSEATEKAEALISAMLRAAIEEFDSTSGTQYEARFRRDMVAARGALIELVAKLERERDEALARLASIAMERDAAQRELDLFGIENAGHWRDVGDIIKVAIENATFPLEERIRHLEERERTLLPKAERCDRYEAPGPAVLRVETLAPAVEVEHAHEGMACRCYGRVVLRINSAYREQHARDVAIVAAVEDEALGRVVFEAMRHTFDRAVDSGFDATGSYWTTNSTRAARDVRAAILRALKGET